MHVAQPLLGSNRAGVLFLVGNGAWPCVFLAIPCSNRFVTMSEPQRNKVFVVFELRERRPASFQPLNRVVGDGSAFFVYAFLDGHISVSDLKRLQAAVAMLRDYRSQDRAPS
jgi:hypothetical protein